MAADQDRADRIRQLKKDHPEYTWQAIADRVGVSLRAAQSWQERGGIEYENAKKLAEMWDEDLDYIMRGRRPETPDLFPVPADDGDVLTRLAQIEAKLSERVEHDKAVEELLANQNTLLTQQSELLDAIRAVVSGLGVPNGTTLQDHLVQLVRDTAVRDAAELQRRREKS